MPRPWPARGEATSSAGRYYGRVKGERYRGRLLEPVVRPLSVRSRHDLRRPGGASDLLWPVRRAGPGLRALLRREKWPGGVRVGDRLEVVVEPVDVEGRRSRCRRSRPPDL